MPPARHGDSCDRAGGKGWGDAGPLRSGGSSGVG